MQGLWSQSRSSTCGYFTRPSPVTTYPVGTSFTCPRKNIPCACLSARAYLVYSQRVEALGTRRSPASDRPHVDAVLPGDPKVRQAWVLSRGRRDFPERARIERFGNSSTRLNKERGGRLRPNVDHSRSIGKCWITWGENGAYQSIGESQTQKQPSSDRSRPSQERVIKQFTRAGAI